MIVDNIRRFVESQPASAPAAEGSSPSAEFERLALEAFAYQFDRIVPYRAMCERAGKVPGAVSSWRDVPMIPAAAFATLPLATAPAVETFRSSGTRDAARSVHHHAFPELYRAAIEASFPHFCLPRGERPPMLALVPPRSVAADSSLGFMIDHVVAKFGGAGSDYAFGARGVEGAKARSWFGARQREGRPVLLLATSFALADLLEFIARIGLKFRLPAGSALFETGGFKGRSRTLKATELHAQMEDLLCVPRGAVVGEYGMTELTSQCYTAALRGGDPTLFLPPQWMQVRALDPVTLAELPPGQTGLLAFFDLANVGSALHLLTEDLGSLEGRGFRLAGRAPEADLRGCSLLAEELGAAAR